LEIHQSKAEQRIGISLLGGQLVPFHGPAIISLHALAVPEHIPQLDHSCGIALVGLCSGCIKGIFGMATGEEQQANNQG
jgi:hypothetical protein